MKKRLMSLVLAAAMAATPVFGTGILSIAAGVPSGDTYVYIPIKDLSNASRYEGTGILENFEDDFSGGLATGNKTLLLQSSGDSVEYDVDLDDGVTSAVLKLYASAAVVSVRPENGGWTTLNAKNGGAANRGVNLFDLTADNALASPDRKFTVRVSRGGSDVVLNSLAVAAGQSELSGSYRLDPLGESYLRQVEDVSSGASRFFDNQTEPAIHLHNGEHVTLRFDYDDKAKGFAYSYGIAGATPLTGEVSADGGTTWKALSAGGKLQDAVNLPENNVFFLRFTARDGDTFLKSLTITPEYDAIPVEDTWYSRLADLTGTSAHGGNISPNFNDTAYSGDPAFDNKTLLLNSAGDFVEYPFDLADSAVSAVLKLYNRNAVVSVKPEGGEFIPLKARNDEGGGFDRNVAVYDLSADNALTRADKRFTLRIESPAGSTVLQAMNITVREPVLEGGYVLDPLGESYLQNLYTISQGATRYFDNATEPTVQLGKDQSAVFRFAFTAQAAGFQYAFTQVGEPLKAEVSADGAAWHPLAAGGRIEEAMSLPADRTFYIRFTAESGQSYLKSLTITPVFQGVEEKSYVYLPVKDLSNADRFGGSSIKENFTDSYSGGKDDKVDNKTLLLQNAGDYVEYDINLPDGVDRAVLKAYIKDAVVSVKPTGGEFKTLKARNDTGGRFDRNVAIFDLTAADALASDDRQFTVRVAAKGGSEAAVLNALLVETAQPELTGGYRLDPLGESFLRNLADISQGASRYFAAEKDPTVFLHNGESVTFRFDFTDKAQGFRYAIGGMGKPLTSEISADGTAWTALPAGGSIEDVIILNSERVFYIRLRAERGDSFLKTLTVTPTVKGPEQGDEKDYVYLPIKDMTGVKGFGGGTIVENFSDTFSGGVEGKAVNPTLLLQNAGDYVEYGFNLTDARTSALLKIYMKDAVVSVKPEGGQYVTLKARNDRGGRFDRGVAIYDLNTSNALAAASRKFTVRIAANGADAAVVNGLVMDAADGEIASGRYDLAPLGESFLQGVWDLSQNTTRYFYQESIPTVYIKQGGQVTFRLRFAPGGKGYTASYVTQGAQAAAEVSLDGKTWTALKGKRVDKALNMNGSGTYFLRFSAKDGDTFLQSLSAARETVEPAVERNANPNVPKDATYAYFKPGTAAEEKYMFGLGVNYKDYFEKTGGGMGIDGFEGGYNASLPKNVRLFHGKQLTYEFDLNDSLKEARLKVYGLGDMTFLVSADEGETYDVLTTKNKPTGNGRGYYIFDLNESNALKNAGNKFRLQIKGAYGMLFELMIESGAPALTRGVQFQAQGEDGMRYLEASSGLRTYYAYEAFPNYFLNKDGSLLYKVPFAEGVDAATLYVSYCGGVKVAVGNRPDGGFDTLLTSEIGSTGTPPTNTYDLSAYLKKGRTVYIRVTGMGDGGFVDSLGVAVTPKNESEGGFRTFDGAEAGYLYSVTNHANGVGTSMRQTVGLNKVRGVDVGGEVVYRFDLTDSINGVDILLDAQGKFDLTASVDGENFSSVTSVGKKTDALRVQELLAGSRDKVLYLKIRNASTSDILLLHSLKFSTKGVPEPYTRPVTPDFDYSKTLPDSFPTIEKLKMPEDPKAVGSANTDGGFPWLWVSVGGGAVILAAGGVTAGMLIRRKKLKGKNDG